MEPEMLIREGGFAFAALLMAVLLIRAMLILSRHMDERGRWVDKLLVRLERTEESHTAMTTALERHTAAETEMLKSVTASLQEVQIKLASLNGGSRR